ncbi:MAG TPA: hypothetical protein VJ995_04245 [Geothermobacteraceae bacterium]|nr:hypothetical protein [Geothermobacteraceae bacterium]
MELNSAVELLPLKPIRVLFLCTGNSCRSQMAHGLVNHDFKGFIAAFSAGTEPQGLNPQAVQVMAESVSISLPTARTISAFTATSVSTMSLPSAAMRWTNVRPGSAVPSASISASTIRRRRPAERRRSSTPIAG